MNAQLERLIQDAKDRWAASQADGRVKVNVVLDTSSIAKGAEATIDIFRDAAKRSGTNVEITPVGSWGFCWLEPCVSVRSAAGTRTVLYREITPDVAEEFFQRVVVEGTDMPDFALGVVEGNSTPEIP
ncbi:MAG: hypothetical protein ACM3S1_06255, partial [Hyphomicrobiales bacterium]